MIEVHSISLIWRYAVGPSCKCTPAIPFFFLKNAKEFFDECKREIPDFGVVLYKKNRKSELVTIQEYVPGAKPAPARSGAQQ